MANGNNQQNNTSLVVGRKSIWNEKRLQLQKITKDKAIPKYEKQPGIKQSLEIWLLRNDEIMT